MENPIASKVDNGDENEENSKNAENEKEQKSSEYQVIFVTNSCDPVPETQFSVPGNLSRFGLSEIVNHLLNAEKADDAKKHIPFDFLINGEFLRTSLYKFLKRRSISGVRQKQ